MIKYLRQDEINVDKWDQCISHSVNGMIYAFSWYLDIVNNRWEALVEGDYERVMPLTPGKKANINYLFQPPFTQQLGIFSTSHLTSQVVNDFIKAIPSKYKLIEINLNTYNKPDSQTTGFTPWLTHELDLISDYDTITKNYSNNLKRNLKKARQSKLSISEHVRPEELITIFKENKGKELKYWVDEYKIDGFRFDLMGIHDIETMNIISNELHAIEPTLFLYGEGWKAGDSPFPEDKLALKQFTYKLDKIAAFSDDLRDGIKGSWSDHKGKGFVNGNFEMAESVKFGVVGATEHHQVNYSKVNYSRAPWAGEPYQCINYVSCHDNHTLFDKLCITNPEATNNDLIKMHKLANTIVMTSQGVPFLHAGVDFVRTKQRVENSYQSPDSINQIDWIRKYTYRKVFDYYRDLITLRKQYPVFKMTNTELINKHLNFLYTNHPGIVAFKINDFTEAEKWKSLIVVYNASQQSQSIKLPVAKWLEIFNSDGLNRSGYRIINNNLVNVAAISAIVLEEINE
jgi:hypothetical protein